MKASIVIPNLNGAGWLRDSIESIWAQTEQDFELIIIDNGSTDESLAIARSYVGRPGYTLVENQTNTGFSAAVNTGIGLAKANMWCCSTTMPLHSRTGWHSSLPWRMPSRALLRCKA